VPASAVACESLVPTSSSVVTNIIRNDLSTDVTNGTVPKGTIVHDTATVTGGGDGTSKPTGTVTFQLFATADCTGAHTDQAVSPLTAGTGTTATAASSNVTVNAALSFKATYSGDSVYPAVAASAVSCESLSPTGSSVVTGIIRNDLSTDVTNGTVPAGTVVHDTATVTGSGDGTSKPTGSVTFQLFATGDCTGSHTDQVVTPLTAGSGTSATAASSNTTVNAALSYKATYSGDSVYPAVAAADVSCESLSPTASALVTNIIRNDLSTDVTNATVPSGTIVHDTATITGSGDGTSKPTGTVTFERFATSDCTGTHVDEPISPLTAGAANTSTAASSNVTVTAALSFKATYSGDSVYPPIADTAVACESLSPTTSSLVTHIVRNSDSADVTNTIVIVGTSVHDTATVTGSGDGAVVPTGNVTFQLFATKDCTGAHTDEVVALPSGTAAHATAASSNTTANADLSYKAIYGGDANYPAVAASAVDCESLQIVNPATRLSISDQIINLPSDATGTVTYGVFTDSQCASPVTTGAPSDGNITPSSNTVGAGGIAPSSLTYTPTGSGTFYVKATFTGSGTYAGVVFTSCTERADITE
jgi:predicted transglutaminase-like cysteine proteinase